MARIDFPNGFEGVENLPRTNRNLLNCWNNGKGQIINRFGISQVNTTTRVARGSFVWNGSLYHVASQDLLKITNLDTGAFSVIGTIAGSDPVETAVGNNHAVIVVRGGALYTLDTSDVLTDISGNANFEACDDVVHLDDRFVYVPTDGGPVFFSDVGAAGTVNALSFFDPQVLPDKNRAAIVFKNTLFILGEGTIEPYINTGASPVPFSRITNGSLRYGYHGGLLPYTDSFLFVGKEQEQDVGIYSASRGRATKISNERIDKILSTYTETELSETIANRIKWRGYDVATFVLRRDSFGFVGGRPFEMDSIIGGSSRPWAGGYVSSINSQYYTAFSNKIGKIAKVNTDYNERVTRIMDLALETENYDSFTCQSIKLGISQGYNAAVGSVSIQMTRDGVNYGQPVDRTLAPFANYRKPLIFNPPGGLGTYPDGWMGVRLYTTEDVDFSSDHLIARIRA